MTRLRIGVTGVSHWHADMHLSAFRTAGADIAAVCDLDQTVSEDFGRRFRCPVFTDLDALLERVRPDFVMVMGTPSQMLTASEHLLDEGIPFAVEKPLGRSAAEARSLVERVTMKGLFATVPLVNRYSRLWQRLEELRARGRSSTLSHAHFRIVNGAPGRYRSDGVGWVLDPEVYGGGAFRNLGIHGADAFLELCGDRSYEVLAAALHSRVHGGSVEEFCTALLETEEGMIATIEAGYSYPTLGVGGDFEWRVATDDAYFIDRDASLEVAVLNEGPERKEPNLPQSERYAAFGRDVVRRVLEGAAPRVSLVDAHRAMELVDHVYAAARSGLGKLAPGQDLR